MKTNFYISNDHGMRLFTSSDPDWGALDRWPQTKKGLPSKAHPGNAYLLECPELYVRTTTICGEVNAGKVDGLMEWAAGLAIRAALNAPPGADEEAILRDYRALATEARDTGSEFHNLIHQMWKNDDPLWFDNQTDVHRQMLNTVTTFLSEHPNARIIDWKTVGKYANGKYRQVYMSEAMQMAAYRAITQLTHVSPGHEITACASMHDTFRWAGTLDYVGPEDSTEYYNVYIDRDTGELAHVQKWGFSTLELAWNAFTDAYELFYAAAKFKP